MGVKRLENKESEESGEVRGLQMSQKLSVGLEEKLRERICKKCDFYKEGEVLECYAYKVSKKLVEEGKVDLEEL